MQNESVQVQLGQKPAQGLRQSGRASGTGITDSPKEQNTCEETTLLNALAVEGLSVTPEAVEQLLRYHHLLEEKNKVMNLTRIDSFEDAVQKHYVDSLVLGRYLALDEKKTLLDLGSGAGIPGIPLKIAHPALSVTLMDSVGKKVQFQEEVIEALSLENIRAIHTRFEDAAHNHSLREKFDFVTARAVANLSTLAEYALPFVKIGGIFVAYKSGEVEDELEAAKKAIRMLGGRVRTVEKYTLAGSGSAFREGQENVPKEEAEQKGHTEVEKSAEQKENEVIRRSLVMIEKVSATPRRYPRRAGTPSKNPI